MPKLKMLLIMLIISLVFLNGCGSKYEPDELAYVLLIGVDHGAKNLLRISYLIANTKALSQTSGGGGQGGNSLVTTVESPSIYVSTNMVNTYVGRRLTLMHAKGIVFSEAMARDGSMGKIIGALQQFREIRGTMFTAVSRVKPDEILEVMKPVLEAQPAKYMELMAMTQTFTGFIPRLNLSQFYNEEKVAGVDPICIIMDKSAEKLPPYKGKAQRRSEGSYIAGEVLKKGGIPIQGMGAAAFRQGKMVGILNGDETTAVSFFRGNFRRGIFSLDDPLQHGSLLSMEVMQGRKPKIDVESTKEGTLIRVRISLIGDLLGNTSLIDYALEKNQIILEKAFKDLIRKQANDLVRRTQRELKSDILGFGKAARHKVLTQQQWQELNWDRLYPKAKVAVQVDFNIRRTGLFLREMPIPNGKIKEGENPR